MADAAVAAVKAALSGKKLDTHALDQLAFNKGEAEAARDRLIPLLLQLLTKNPEAAASVPENTVQVLLDGTSLEQVLETTGFSSAHLDSEQLRPLLLSQVASKATEHDAELDGGAGELIRRSLQLIVEPQLDTYSVSSIERLVTKIPHAALKHLPFRALHDGPAELRSRLMAANIGLLKHGVVPPQEFLSWSPLASEDDDVLLAALETDYVGDLVPFFTRVPPIQGNVHAALFELCKRYRKTEHSFLTNSIERVLALVARTVDGLFLELDAQYLLVRPERASLIAQLPATYVVNHHPEVVEQLELTSRNLYAVANLTQDFRGLQLLPLTSARVLNLPVPSQLVLAAAATATKEGAELFQDRFGDALKNAWNMPDTQEYADQKATLRANLSRWGIRIRRQPDVQLA